MGELLDHFMNNVLHSHKKVIKKSVSPTPPPVPPLVKQEKVQDDREDELVSVSLGNNLALKINPKEQTDVFEVKHISEGDELQQEGILSYLGLSKCDPFTKILRELNDYLFERRKITNVVRDVGFAPKESPLLEYVLDRLKRTNDDKDLNTSVAKKPKLETKQVPKDSPNKEMIDMFNDNKQDYYRKAEESILKILPPKMSSFHLFCQYFKYVNPFIEILDEHTLLLDINSILPRFLKFSDGNFTEVRIRNDDDLRTMGIFLTVIKLGYQSMVHNDYQNNEYDEQDMSVVKDMSHFDSEKFTHAIYLCIADGFTAGAKSSFKLVQLLAFFYFYKGISRDDSQGLYGFDSRHLLTTAVNHAFAIELDKDPTEDILLSTSKRRQIIIRTWRYLWWYLVGSDTTCALTTGCQLNIDKLNEDNVKYPTPEEDPTGKMTGFITDTIQVNTTIRDILMKFKQPTKIIDILNLANELETKFFDIFGKDFFKDVISVPAPKSLNPKGFDQASIEHREGIVKVSKFCLFIQLRTTLSALYFRLAIHYESKNGDSKTKPAIELFKLYVKSTIQLMYIIPYVLDNSVELFGKNFDFMVTPSIQRCMIIMQVFLSSFFIRLVHQHVKLKDINPSDAVLQQRYQDINNVYNVVLNESMSLVGNLRKLSRTHLGAYRHYIIAYCLLRKFTGQPDEAFDDYKIDRATSYPGKNVLEIISTAELRQLNRVGKSFHNTKIQQLKLKAEQRKKAVIDAATDEEENDPWKDTEFKLFGSDAAAFSSGGEYIFTNQSNLRDGVMDPVIAKLDLLDLFKKYANIK